MKNCPGRVVALWASGAAGVGVAVADCRWPEVCAVLLRRFSRSDILRLAEPPWGNRSGGGDRA